MSAVQLFDALALDYDDHFAEAHRRCYDDLAWEYVAELLPAEPARVLDIGSGVGRWSERFVDLGHLVIGIEPAPAMAKESRRRIKDQTRFRLIESRIEDLSEPGGPFELIVAMGSIQYCQEPLAEIRRAASWLAPGGALAILVDARAALVIELLRRGDVAQARERAQTGRGVWRQGALEAPLTLFDKAMLVEAIRGGGLEPVRAHGLLVGATAFGVPSVCEQLSHDPTHYELERTLSSVEALADLGKQLLAIGHRPVA